jgi:hypothetical protein
LGRPGERFPPRDESLHYEMGASRVWSEKIIIAGWLVIGSQRDKSLRYERDCRFWLLTIIIGKLRNGFL